MRRNSSFICSRFWPPVAHAAAAQQLREFGVAQAFARSLEGDVGRQRVTALATGLAVEALDGEGVALRQRHGPGAGDADASLRGEGHGGVFDQGPVDGLTRFVELDDPGLAVDVEQGLGVRAAECGAGGDEAALGFIHGLTRHDLLRQALHGRRVGQLGQRAGVAREVFAGRDRHAQRAKALVARVKQEVEHRKARRFVEHANDAFAPAVGPGVVHRADGGFFPGG